MKLLAIVAALVGALIGAAIWTTGWVTSGYVGLVVWGIGALAGLGANLARGRGVRMGVACAVIAVVGLAAGRYGTAYRFVHSDAPAYWEQQTAAYEKELTTAAYENLMQVADATAELSGPSQYAEFLVRFSLTEADKPENVKDEELQAFETVTLPVLQRMRADRPSYELWRTRRLGLWKTKVQRELRQVTIAGAMAAGLRPSDRGVLWNYAFMILAVGTAYIIGRGPKATAVPANARSGAEATKPRSHEGQAD